MSACTGGGWGLGPWGQTQWGLGDAFVPALLLLGARAVRENLVRLSFTLPPTFSFLLDAHDASNPERYSIAPVGGTFGLDELPCRPVAFARAEPAASNGGTALEVDLTTDRPLSPFPARYVVATEGLQAGALDLDPCASSAQCLGLLQLVRQPSLDNPIPSRDFAHPDNRFAAEDPLPNADDPLALGTIPVDATGDYAFDEGLANLQKRVFRRVFTRRNGFVHLPGYGVGLAGEVKRLSSVSQRQRIAADAETQIRQEPDVVACRVVIVNDPSLPGLARFNLLVKSKHLGAVVFDVPVRTS